MSLKRVYRYFRPGNLTGLEATLNAMSAGGWQAVKPGRFVQSYRREEGAFLHRFAYCGHRPGSAGEISFLAAQEQAGWTLRARRGGWLLYRRPAAGAEEGAQLPDGRESVRALFRQRTARLESLRRWLLVMGTVLLLGGYASALRPVFYATVLPLAAALCVTYRIKFMEEGIGK